MVQKWVMSHSTHYMSCRRWFSPPTSWLVQKLIFLTNHSADTCRTNTTTTKWQYKTMNDNYRHAKLNLMKLKPGSRRLLHLPARKRIRPTLQIPGPARGTHTLIQTDQTYSTAPRARKRIRPTLQLPEPARGTHTLTNTLIQTVKFAIVVASSNIN